MSTLKVNNLQVGQDSTATNNLTWFQPGSPDGSIRLGSGNAGSATTKFTFDKDGNLTCVGNINAASILAPIEGTLDDWIIHAGDTNTKFGFSDADQFQVQTGGSPRLTVTNTYVTATGLLTVEGGSAAKPTFKHSAGWGALRVAGSAGGSGSGFILANNYSGTIEEKWSIYLDGSNDGLRFTAGPPETTSAEKLRITSAGKVLIGDGGTYSPSGLLHIVGDDNSNGPELYLQTNNNNTTDNIGALWFGNNVDKTLVKLAGHTHTANNTADFTVSTSSGGTLAERLRIASDGHVRIQHNTTNAKIILSRNVSVGTDDVSTGVLDFANNTAHTVNSRIMGKTSGTGNVGGQLVVETRDESTSTLTEKIRIKSNGKVGLGHHSASQITHELTIRPANNGGISIKRPGDTISNPNIHLDITTTAAGSAFPSGEAYTVKYKSMNCDQIFETYAGGGTGGNISFRANTSNNSNETLRITKDGTVNIGGDYAQTSAKLFVTGGSGSDGNITLLQLKHANTVSSSGAGDGPAMLFNGEYQNNPWAFAKICSVNSGSGYGADFQIHVHPANGTQGASLVKALSIVGDGASGADVMLPDGNIKFAQGHGVSFINAADVASGETVASSVLDDYEEGTYTPTISNLGNHTTTTGNTYGAYTKIGDLVTVRFRYQWTNRSTTNGAYNVILSLPFTGANVKTPGHGSCAVEGCQPNSSDRTSYHSSVPQNAAYVQFRCSGANNSENSFNGSISTSLSNGYFMGVVSYKTT